ncbi:MAG: cytochrome c oxidase subunit II transmembrane domain-containing protein [Povalibacter sp.]
MNTHQTLLSQFQEPVLWICAGGGLLVFAAMLYSVASFRRKPGSQDRAPTAEVLWAIVPILIVIAAAAPAFKGLFPNSHTAPNVADAIDVSPPSGAPGEMPQKAFNEAGVPL